MISYIDENTVHTATNPNSIYTYFDNILDKMLGGRSFVLVYPPNDLIKSSDYTAATCPRNILGKTFFFTNQNTSSLYVYNVPGAKIVTGQKVQSYNHDSFNNAVATSVVLSTGSAGDIVTVGRYASTYYTASTQNNYVGLLDNSLQCHKLNVSGSEYYIREAWYNYVAQPSNRDITIPEKRYKYAVADIFIENYSGSFTYKKEWDKYECLRIHNLNNNSQSLVLEARNGTGSINYDMSALECRTFRLNTDNNTYSSQSMRYFWDYRADDKRFYYYKPSYIYEDGYGVHNGLGYSTTGYTGQENSIRNSHVGNNLINFSVILDWIYSLRKLPYGNQSKYYGHLILDDTLLHGINETGSLWGAYNNDSTPIMDLIWHKGNITYTITSGSNTLSSSTITYNGYADIVGTFSSASVNVIESGSTLYLSSSLGGSKYTTSLSARGTNIFDQGDVKVSSIVLNNNLYRLNNAIFEYKSDPVYFVSSSYVSTYDRIYNYSTSSTPANISWYLYDGTYVANNPIDTASLSGLVTASVAKTLGSLGSMSLSLSNPVTVGDIKTLKYFGNYTSGSNQDDSYVTYTDKVLKLTDQGIVLTFNENLAVNIIKDITKAAKPYWVDSSGTYPKIYELSASLSGSKVVIPHTIKFRTNGYGYPENGSDNAIFFTAGDYRFIDSNYYTNRMYNSNGSDFTDTIISPLKDYSSATYLERIPTTTLLNTTAYDRFWRLPSYQLLPLSHIHYNMIARYVNSIKGFIPLSYKCLRFYRQYNSGFDPYNIGISDDFDNFSANLPMPVNCFFSFSSGSTSDLPNYSYIYNKLNVPIRTTASFSQDYIAALSVKSMNQYIATTTTGSYTNTTRTGNYITTDFNCTYSHSLSSSYYGNFGDIFYPYNVEIAQNAYNLPTLYNNILWVSIEDVQSGLYNFGFRSFNYFSLYEPYIIETLYNGDKFITLFGVTQSYNTSIAGMYSYPTNNPSYTTFNNTLISYTSGWNNRNYAKTVYRYCEANETASFKKSIDDTIAPADIYNYQENNTEDYNSNVTLNYLVRHSGIAFSDFGTYQQISSYGTIGYTGAGSSGYYDTHSLAVTTTTNKTSTSTNKYVNILMPTGSSATSQSNFIKYIKNQQGKIRSIGTCKYTDTGSFYSSTTLYLYSKDYYKKQGDWYSLNKAKWTASLNTINNVVPYEVKRNDCLAMSIPLGYTVICPTTNSCYTYLYDNQETIHM